MDTKSAINELASITKEITLRTNELKKLRDRKNFLEENIKTYLDQKELPGVKCNSISVQFDERKGHEKKKKVDKQKDSIDLLVRCGVPNPEKILRQLSEVQKGDEIVVKKLKINVK